MANTNHSPIVKFYSHSQIFYFWPVWVTAYICALISWLYEYKMDLYVNNQPVVYDVILYPHPYLGLLFILIMIAVIAITSINIRGLWVVILALLLLLFGALVYITQSFPLVIAFFENLKIFMSYHSYLTIAMTLSLLWVMTVFVYDRRRYAEFRSSQFTVVEEVGDKMKSFDTKGMTITRERDNFFQHVLLGFGSGDVVVIPAHGDKVFCHNVLKVNRVIADIQSLLNH